MSKKSTLERKIDTYFNCWSDKYPNQIDRIIGGICAIVMFFSLLGLSWSLPFPYLHFLGQYNSYFNWASFVIAFSIYYYSGLSPVLSYLMLFLALLFTYFITILEKQLNNRWLMFEMFFLILSVCFLVRYLMNKIAGKSSTLKMELLFILIGPVWSFHFLLKKLNISY